MEIKKIQEIDVKNKKVLLRVDFNVAVENENAREKYKIEAAGKSVKYLLDQKAKVALVSHLGRPEGKVDPRFSFQPIADDVERILGVKVRFVSDCIGANIKENLENLQEGEILLLENVRFYAGEEENDAEFSQKLADNFEIFVNDAFSVCHRNQASVTGIAKNLSSCGGFWLQKEIKNLDEVKNNPQKPAVAIIGGAKIETKLPLIKSFEKSYDYILVGGKIANEALDQKIKFGEKVILPVDFAGDRLDIGPKTIDNFKQIISSAKTIVWNGPMGKFEEAEYATGTKEVLAAVIGNGAHTLMGGGESVEILEKEGAMQKIDFVSTGGGAMLEYLSGNPMPGLKVLEEVA
jgi:3-phosphoglycerate kinase